MRPCGCPKKGFTLIELLVVAVILAVLAAVVVPQFADSSSSAKEAALRAELASLRAAIDLYRQQHGAYPGNVDPSSPTACDAAVPAVSTREDAVRSQLVYFSNGAGQTCSTSSGGQFRFGPYLKTRKLPTNPVNGQSSLRVIGAADLNLVGDGEAAGGWKYDRFTGRIIANDTARDAAGVRYDRY
ncbi:MAG: prepilin-type N-terminal cleavage/methylation domain-containing protein [Pseudomonadales bacterium]|nr:prepilin-type N-terminal cleavage/methylation domain-containing protein [Pseudomonadales bacterium]MCP5184413.1 prepilin-type N-terminal cleavage/methylation domain-containing protein [Pseudomonadales bacterium]